jgi:hypothetical protein
MHPSTAATVGKLRPQQSGHLAAGKSSLKAGGTDKMNRIGGHVFGMDPEHNKYYNRTEHGTHLIREALNQRQAALPRWA